VSDPPVCTERAAELGTGGWGVINWQPVIVVEETAQKYRIRATAGVPVRIRGRRNWLVGDATALVPKSQVRFPAADCGQVPKLD
jgi:hypothetical protein